MDKREMELLMDRYKKEMLEFSRKKPLPKEEKCYPYSRDRSDPLPEEKGESTADKSNIEHFETQGTVGKNFESERSGNGYDDLSGGETNIDSVLRKEYERINNDKTASSEQKRRGKEISDFLAMNPEHGTLKVEAFASDRAFGIGSARVMVFVPLDSGNITVYDGYTDISGDSETLKLPAPPKSLSLSPSAGNRLPYAGYTVYVEHPNYVRAVFNNVPVFSGIGSIQPVRMLAKVSGTQEPSPIVVDTDSENTL